MTWANPENVTGFVSLLVYVNDLFPDGTFAISMMMGLFFTLFMIFKQSSGIGNAAVASGFITWLFGVFFFAMGLVSGKYIIGISVCLALIIFWVWIGTSEES